MKREQVEPPYCRQHTPQTVAEAGVGRMVVEGVGGGGGLSLGGSQKERAERGSERGERRPSRRLHLPGAPKQCGIHGRTAVAFAETLSLK